MVIIAMVSYAPEGANEMGKRFLGLKPLPGYITMKGPFVGSTKGEGIQVITLFECDRAKLPDAFEYVGNRYTAYFGVPGFTYTVQVWFDITEALKMIGLA